MRFPLEGNVGGHIASEGCAEDRLVRLVGIALLTFASVGSWAEDDRIQVINVIGPGLNYEDAQAISEGVSNVARAEMSLSERMKVGFGTTYLEVAVFVDEHPTPRANFAGGETWPLDLGTFISDRDDAEASKVAVIGGPVRDRLFGDGAKPLGEQILIAGVGFRVVGVLGPHPPFVDDLLPDLDGDWDEESLAIAFATRVYVPFSAGRPLLSAAAKNDALIRVWVKDQASFEATRAEVRQMIEQRIDGPLLLEIATFPPSSLPTAAESVNGATLRPLPVR